MGRIVVAGDPTVDWMIAIPGGQAAGGVTVSYSWEMSTEVAVTAGAGGAALLKSLAQALVSHGELPISVDGIEIPATALDHPHYDGIARTFTVWQEFPRTVGAKENVWRLFRFMGRDTPRSQTAVAQPAFDGEITVLLIDDTNFGARNGDFAGVEAANDGRGPDHIILRMTNPLAEGRIWEHLVPAFGDRITLCLAASDLRKEHAPIGQALSWERTASEVAAAVKSRPEFDQIARVIVNVGYGGAILYERGKGTTLVYDPFHQEGDWERKRPGFSFGIGVCVAVGVAVEAARNPNNPDWRSAVIASLDSSRTCVDQGQQLVHDTDRTRLKFPFSEVARAYFAIGVRSPVEAAPLPEEEDWRLFGHAFKDGYRNAATEIALNGDRDACKSLPVERMGAWASVDRTEIESMRSLRNIVGEYLAQPRRGRPLNLAVFGPPGSGKSFAIKQMAKQWEGGAVKIETLEFNVSQFGQPSDLPAALQRVRDCAVRETIPLVFWDEFDSRFGGNELGWLAQFLAPMQDGIFLENGNARPIGPAIFIFAGGTHATMESFKSRAVEIPGAKATDFLSRLRGFVDILGPNPSDAQDETFLLRRALLLRAVLRGKAPRLFDGERLSIDPGVLRAFLDVTTYLHGSRSMESVVDMSSTSGSLRYERSSLPAAHQLGLHVDPEHFLNLVHQEIDR